MMRRIIVLLLLLVPSICFGAAFTSTGTGNWNDGGTWGNASPGVKGTDWPGSAGDTAEIGHTVTYNVSETNEMGEIGINASGILTFKTDANTKLTMGHADIEVNSGGELRVGTSGATINVANTAELIWNTTADNARGIEIFSGGTVNIYGAQAYYTTRETTLADNADNTDGDTDIVTSDDMSSDWNVGDRIVIVLLKDYNGTWHEFSMSTTISGFAGTTITVADNVTAEAGVGSSWIAQVINMSRNVTLSKSGASEGTNTSNSNRPLIEAANSSQSVDVALYDAEFHGFYQVLDTSLSTDEWTAVRCTARNGYLLGGNARMVTITDCDTFEIYNPFSQFFGSVVSGCNIINARYFGQTVSTSEFTNCFFGGSNYGIQTGHEAVYKNCSFTGTSTALSYQDALKIQDSYIYGCNKPVAFLNGEFINVEIGWDSDGNQVDNITADFRSEYPSPGGYYFSLINCKAPSGGYTFDARNQYLNWRYAHEHYDQTLNAHKIHCGMGDITKTACDGTGDSPSVDPDGGNGDVVEVHNLQSNLEERNVKFMIFEHTFWKTAAAYTVTYKLQTTYAAMGAGDIKMEIDYLDGSGDVQTATEEATAVTVRANDADWTQSISDTFTVGTEGWVRVRLYLLDYEANDELYVWPTPTWS